MVFRVSSSLVSRVSLVKLLFLVSCARTEQTCITWLPYNAHKPCNLRPTSDSNCLGTETVLLFHVWSPVNCPVVLEQLVCLRYLGHHICVSGLQGEQRLGCRAHIFMRRCPNIKPFASPPAGFAESHMQRAIAGVDQKTREHHSNHNQKDQIIRWRF